MPFFFRWTMEDSRDVGWQFYDKDRNMLNPAEATKNLSFPETVPPREYWPLRIRQVSRHKKISDFGALPDSSTLVVNRRARDLFESFEPGRHIYVPLEATLFTGEVVSDEYWLFRNQNWVDGGLVAGLSQVGWVRSPIPPFENCFYSAKSINPSLTWNCAKISDLHIWADSLLKRFICISDELATEIGRQKFKYYRFTEGGVV